MKQKYFYIIFGALLVGLIARIPGIFWGYNFPTGWCTHHVDEWTHIVNSETIINPRLPPRWSPHPYPKGMAAHVSVPIIGYRVLKGELFKRPPKVSKIFITGRVISVLYGTATILIVFLLAKQLFRDIRVAHITGWIFALGGLHVSQSHFFLADVPCLFWFLLGSYLLFKKFESRDDNALQYLSGAAFCFGIAFGLKLLVIGLPTLVLLTIMKKPRLLSSVQVAVFFLAGFILVNVAFYTPYDFAQTLHKGLGDPSELDWIWSFFLYLIEIPNVVSFPVLLFLVVGSYCLMRKLINARNDERFNPILLIIVLPLAINNVFIIFKHDHFARHLIPLIPWISMVSALGLVKTIDKLKLKGFHSAFVMVPFFVYLALFVFDGERPFIKEPRNEAAKWLYQNLSPGTDISWVYHGQKQVPGFNHVYFPDKGRPKVLVMEMHEANHYLSGIRFKNSYPKDHRFVFDGRSKERLESFQKLFKGESDYREVARFKEGYFMPEYRIVDWLLGNRSRNYVAEIVIFLKKGNSVRIK